MKQGEKGKQRRVGCTLDEAHLHLSWLKCEKDQIKKERKLKWQKGEKRKEWFRSLSSNIYWLLNEKRGGAQWGGSEASSKASQKSFLSFVSPIHKSDLRGFLYISASEIQGVNQQPKSKERRRKRAWEQDWMFGGNMHEDVKLFCGGFLFLSFSLVLNISWLFWNFVVVGMIFSFSYE